MATVAARPAVRLTTTVASDLAELVGVRDALADALAGCGWSREDTFRTLICADEALANAHAHGHATSVDVQFTVDAAAATLVVCDQGSAPCALPPASELPAESAEHGRGLILMRALADRFSVWPGPTGTMVALVVRAGTGGVR